MATSKEDYQRSANRPRPMWFAPGYTGALEVDPMIRSLLVSLLMLLGLGTAVHAQTPVLPPVASSTQTSAIVGTWQIQASGPSFLLVQTYYADNTMTSIHDEHATRNTQLGTWTQVGDRQFLMRNVSYRFDASGQVTATIENRGVYTVAPDGNTMTGRGIRFEVDLAGADLGPAVSWETQATRL